MQITDEVRAQVQAMAGRRCECHGDQCRHHLKGARCKRGLRGDQWKIFWRTESGGLDRGNIEAWCLECFSNNFAVPTETLALLSSDIAQYARILDEDQRRAITLRSVFRDVANRIATDARGRLVDNMPDNILLEFARASDAFAAARKLSAAFHETTQKLDLPTPPLRAGLHCGEVTRWRNGYLAGEAIESATKIRTLAPAGRIVLSDPVVAELGKADEMEPVPEEGVRDLPDVTACWALPL
jgi:class 3 adenylate cyclase